MLTAQGNRLSAQTRTLSAVFENGTLTSLKRNKDGREFIRQGADGPPALELIYPNAEAEPLGGHDRDRATVLPLNDHAAEIRFESWYGDGLLAVSEDVETGDLIVEPSGYASRPSLRAVRWMLCGLAPELELVAPFFQGVRMPLEHGLLAKTHWHWPHFWEAGLAILQAPAAGGGFWVHCRDTQYHYKSLQVGTAGEPRVLGFETEARGPIDANLASGGLAWRVNVFDGDWQAPAAVYRDWLERAWGLAAATRPAWLAKLRFAVSWCPLDDGILEFLAGKFDPATVLLHIPHWRSDKYDQNYPTYAASPAGRAFIGKAQAMGFRTMPHMNSIDMDPKHPAYQYIRDFQYRAVESKRVEGWVHDGQVRPVHESNAMRLRHQDKNTMVKVHPGLAMWRSILAEEVKAAAADLKLDTVFLDVTLNTWNLYNCMVENQTATEGMRRLIRQIASLGGGLAVGGEGRNEIVMQDEFLGQAHLFKSWSASMPGLETLVPCPLNEALFGRWCRTFGYHGLAGKNADQEWRMELHRRLGAIPTTVVASAAELTHPTPAVARLLKEAME